MYSLIVSTILFPALTAQVVPTIGIPYDTVELCYSDALQFQNPQNLRYIWISGKLSKDLLDDAKVMIYELNINSRSQNRIKPAILASDKAMVIRVDTSLMTRNKQEWYEFVDIWEELRFDGKFAGLITKGSLKLGNIEPTGVSRKVVTQSFGQRRIVEEPAKTALERDGVLRFVPQHVGPKWTLLANLLQTEVPIVSHSYFDYRAFLSIQGNGIYKTLYGGLYYKLSGIPTSKDQKKQNDLDVLLESLGVGGRGKTAKQIFEDLPSDQRAAMFKSGVTDNLRLFEIFPTLAGRGFPAWFRLTSDFSKTDIDIDQSPIANLLAGTKPKAHEGIFTRPNGFPGFVLYDNKFKLQEVVPDDVAKDHDAIRPQLGQLQPPASCVRCHARGDGWQAVKNDIKSLLDSKRVDIVGDLSQRDQQEANARIFGLYMGSFEETFRAGRNHYNLMIYEVTGPWSSSKDQLNLVKLVAERQDKIMQNYWHTPVTAKIALYEMGFEVEEKEAPDFLAKKILGLGDRLIITDPRVAALIAGLSINRFEYNFIYSYIMR